MAATRLILENLRDVSHSIPPSLNTRHHGSRSQHCSGTAYLAPQHPWVFSRFTVLCSLTLLILADPCNSPRSLGVPITSGTSITYRMPVPVPTPAVLLPFLNLGHCLLGISLSMLLKQPNSGYNLIYFAPKPAHLLLQYSYAVKVTNYQSLERLNSSYAATSLFFN